jgi:Ice-binding-like
MKILRKGLIQTVNGGRAAPVKEGAIRIPVTREVLVGFRPLCLVIAAAAVMLPRHDCMAIPAIVNLGTDSSFAILAGSGITDTGPTTIIGDIGSYPTTSITGLANISLTGANQSLNSSVMITAQSDLTTAFNDAAGRTPGVTYTGGSDIGGLTLTSGVYFDSSVLAITGTLTLNAQGNSDAVFIFQVGSALNTATGSKVLLENGAQACHVFWEVGSSATLETTTEFVGNILAKTSITLDTGATVDGRLLAENGAVTLDSNTITEAICNDTIPTGTGTGGTAVPDAGNTLPLLGCALAALLAFRPRVDNRCQAIAR